MQRDIDVDLIKLAKEDALRMETVQMTTEEARDFISGKDVDIEELEACLDVAQGSVYTGEADVAYVLIKIVK
jgi:NOL1/NOP2/fmu family ribosome biogenesis protein